MVTFKAEVSRSTNLKLLLDELTNSQLVDTEDEAVVRHYSNVLGLNDALYGSLKSALDGNYSEALSIIDLTYNNVSWVISGGSDMIPVSVTLIHEDITITKDDSTHRYTMSYLILACLVELILAINAKKGS